MNATGSTGGPGTEIRVDGRSAAWAFAAYLAATVALTWPLASAPWRLGLPNMDVYGNVWAMASVLHQLRTDPLHLFDSNMFHPWTRSLAYAESLLPQALQAAPIRALGASPLLAYNVVFLLTFALSGLGVFLLATELARSRTAGFLAGLAFAFFAYRWDHAVHLQSLSTQWMPMALWLARRSVRGGGTTTLLGLAACTALQMLSSGYYGMLLLLALALVFVWEWARDRAAGPRRFIAPGLAVAMAVAAALPVFLQYRAMQARHGFTRGRHEAVAWSARPRSYLDPGPVAALPHTAALHSLTRDGEPMFPGSWALLFGLWAALQVRRHREGALPLAWTALGFALSLGPVVRIAGLAVPGPFELFRLLPGGALLRTPARLGVLAVLGLAVLAALAWARVLGAHRRRLIYGGFAAAFILAEAYPAGLASQIRDMPAAPSSAEWLARAERGVVLELPWSRPADSALYLYWSTAHWQPMVNGFGSFDPPGSADLGVIGHGWPSVYTARVFRERGIRYVVVHVRALTERRRERVLTDALPPRVRLVHSAGETRVYEIEP